MISNTDISGNRCGHNPAKIFHWSRPEGQITRPALLNRAMGRLKHFTQNRQYLKRLQSFHNDSHTRRQRSEARERDALLIASILHYTDLAQLAVGCYDRQTGRFKPLKWGQLLNFIRKQCEASGRGFSESRLYRSLRNLEGAGYLRMQYRTKIEDGEIRADTAIKYVSPRLFRDLGLKSASIEKARQMSATRTMSRLRVINPTLNDEALASIAKTPRNAKPAAQQKTEDLAKRRAARTAELYRSGVKAAEIRGMLESEGLLPPQ